MAGSAPLSRGYKGIMPKAVFKLLVFAGKSFIKIKQLNCEVIVRKHLMVIVNKLCGIKSTNRINKNMREQVMRLTTVSLDVTIAPAVEERRLLWTTYDNLNLWFMGFKDFLIKYGFAMLSSDGGLVFVPKILRHILNVGETELSLNGSRTQAGGRQAILYHDPHLPMIMKSVAKSLYKCTGIFGNNAAGEIVLAHFHVPSSATAAPIEIGDTAYGRCVCFGLQLVVSYCQA